MGIKKVAVLMTSDGPVDIEAATREQLIEVIEYLQSEVESLRGQSIRDLTNLGILPKSESRQ